MHVPCAGYNDYFLDMVLNMFSAAEAVELLEANEVRCLFDYFACSMLLSNFTSDRYPP